MALFIYVWSVFRYEPCFTCCVHVSDDVDCCCRCFTERPLRRDHYMYGPGYAIFNSLTIVNVVYVIILIIRALYVYIYSSMERNRLSCSRLI